MAGVAALPLVGCNKSADADPALTPAGKTSDFKAGSFTKVSLPGDGVAYVTKTATGYRAFSGKCTHRGCNINWIPANKEFRCPCHGGSFDAVGNPTGGPPRNPLAVLPTTVTKGTVYLKLA